MCLLIGLTMVFTPRVLYRMLTDRHHKLHQFPNREECDRAVKREVGRVSSGVHLWVSPGLALPTLKAFLVVASPGQAYLGSMDSLISCFFWFRLVCSAGL